MSPFSIQLQRVWLQLGQLGKQEFHSMNRRALGASMRPGREPVGQHTSAGQQRDTHVSPVSVGLWGRLSSRASPWGRPELSGEAASCACCLCPLRLSIKASLPLLDTPREKQAWLGSAEGQLGWIHKQGVTGGHGLQILLFSETMLIPPQTATLCWASLSGCCRPLALLGLLQSWLISRLSFLLYF